jgi:hypothetical protein
VLGSKIRDRAEGLFQGLPSQRLRVDVEVVLARQGDLEDVVGDPLEARLAIEAQKASLRIEDAVPLRGEPREQLLRALEPEPPVDDRKTKDVEPLGGWRGRGAPGGFSAQEPYLAMPAAPRQWPAGTRRVTSSISMEGLPSRFST